MNKTKIVTAIALVFFSIGIMSAITWGAYTLGIISTSGTFTPTYNITMTPSTIDWGDAELDTTITRTVTITNTGSKTIGSLTMITTNLVGITPSDFTITWDLEGQQLDIEASKIATFTFTLTDVPESTWNFDIQISDATG